MRNNKTNATAFMLALAIAAGVPAIAVDGKYLVGGQSFGEVLATTDKLIAKTRSEKPGKK